ncbi:uncharacterized protein EV420DRAFT_116124 [Desarmillaria tabescens]|uniref:Uncharacterized protein n=1 Tax=Armillaria tabescens TaxID=1929756 RepID=A0AA39NRP5_ARMTA|nr:uncharacterized protein EV420DRAFT_116124 [Desarmillaria tabescens]KAK0470450.1 hypothetical protein EV420DRAFT_116124 [Desarmillaria tabescens]
MKQTFMMVVESRMSSILFVTASCTLSLVRTNAAYAKIIYAAFRHMPVRLSFIFFLIRTVSVPINDVDKKQKLTGVRQLPPHCYPVDISFCESVSPGSMSMSDAISHASVSSSFDDSYNLVHRTIPVRTSSLCALYLLLPSTRSIRSTHAVPESGPMNRSVPPSALTANNKVRTRHSLPQLFRPTSYISNMSPDFSVSVSLSSHPRTSSKVFSVLSPLIQRRRQKSADTCPSGVMPSPCSQPSSPSCPVTTEHRLRQLDKLQRVLGEKIPLELVLGPSPHPNSVSLSSDSPTSSFSSQTRLADASPSHNHDGPNHPRRMSLQSETPLSRAVPEPWLAHAPPSDNPNHPKRRQSVTLAPANEPSSSLDYHHRSHSSPAFQPTHPHGSRPSLSITTPNSPNNEHTSLNSNPSSTFHSHSKSSPTLFSPTSVPPTESRPFISLSHSDLEPVSGVAAPDEGSDTRHNRTARELSWDTFTQTFPLPRPDTPFLSSCIAKSDGDDDGDDEVHLGIKKERRQGWSGQWNCDDMREVIERLRDLR